MGKIDKHANIYTAEGELIRRVDKNGILKPLSIRELETMLDELANDKDDQGNIKDPNAVNNINALLIRKYQENPKHLEELQKELEERLREHKTKKTTEEQVKEALEELSCEIEENVENQSVRPSDDPNYSVEKYVEFEEVKENVNV